MKTHKTDISKIKVGMHVFHILNLQIGKVVSIGEDYGIGAAINVKRFDGKNDTWYANVKPATLKNLSEAFENCNEERRKLWNRISSAKEILSEQV